MNAETPPPVPRRPVGRVEFTVVPFEDAVTMVVDDGGDLRVGRAVHFANAYSIALADRHPDYAEILAGGDIVFPDGAPVVWAGRRLHPDQRTRWARVDGPGVMSEVFARSGPGAPRHYLVGGTCDTLDALRAQLACRWPQAELVGWESPPFRVESDGERAARVQRIARSGATHVWVGLGTPKQDYEVRRLADALPVTCLAVGAAFDFLAGTKPRAPRVVQRAGLEWAFRLGTEPRRLAYRYLWGNTRFVRVVLRDALG